MARAQAAVAVTASLIALSPCGCRSQGHQGDNAPGAGVASAQTPMHSVSASEEPLPQPPQSTESAPPVPAYLNGRVASHDGKRAVVFDYNRAANMSSLRIEDADGSHARPLIDLANFHVENPHPDFDAIGTPREIVGPSFSSDDSTVYFMANAWSTDHALYSVDIASGRTRYVVNTNYLEVLDSCKDARLVDKLIVSPHHGAALLNFRGIDPLDWFFLIDGKGMLLGALSDPKAFAEQRCSNTAPTTASVRSKSPRCRPIRCHDDTLDACTVFYLDGGSTTSYYTPDGSPNWAAEEYVPKDCPSQLSTSP